MKLNGNNNPTGVNIQQSVQDAYNRQEYLGVMADEIITVASDDIINKAYQDVFESEVSNTTKVMEQDSQKQILSEKRGKNSWADEVEAIDRETEGKNISSTRF